MKDSPYVPLCVISRWARPLGALACAVLALAAWCLPALAQSAGRLVVARADFQSPPLEYEQNGQVLGLHADLVHGAAARLGLEVEFRSVPWARALHLARTGRVDAVTFVTRTPEREKYLLFLDGNVLHSVRNVFIALAGSAAANRWTGEVASLAGLRVGLVREFSFGEAFDTAPGVQRVEVEHLDLLWDLLLRDRADVLLSEERSFWERLRGNDLGASFVTLEPPLAIEPQYLAFSIPAARGGDLPVRFAAAMAAFRASPEGRALVAGAMASRIQAASEP